MHIPDEAPPDYTANDAQQNPPRQRWRWQKKVWIPSLLAIILVVFAITFGAVFGVKQSQLEDTQRHRDQLLEAQNWPTSSQWDYSPTSTRPYWDTPTSSTSQSSYPYPTSGPSEPTGPILTAEGRVPRDVSAAADSSQLIFWDLRDNSLWKQAEGESSWDFYSNRHFLFAPVSVATSHGSTPSDMKHTAVSVDAVSGRIVYMHFQDGQWGDWQELEFGAQFLRRPAVISRAQDRVDVINVDNEGHMWIVSYDGLEWSEWTELGADITSDVSATTWGEGRIDVFAKNGERVLHKYWNEDSGWAADWSDLGEPFEGGWHGPDEWTGSPLAVSWLNGDEGVIDVFMTSGVSRHKIFQFGEWSDWEPIGASHEGLEFPDTQSIVKGLGGQYEPYAHIISRGTDNCIHYIAHNGTSWDRWDYLWCNDEDVDSELYYPTEYMTTCMVSLGDSVLELVVKDLLGDVLRLSLHTPVSDNRQWSNDDWTKVGQPF